MARRRNNRLVGFGAVSAVCAVGLAILGVGYADQGGVRTEASPLNGAPMSIAAKPPGRMPGWTIPEPAHMPSDPKQAALIKRGEFLTVAGDCLPCHSVEGQPGFSGGRAVATPFGSVFSSNITSSKKYGIGNWTDKQFWNAVHDGISPGSSLVVFPRYEYPVMPYASYSKMTYGDVMAIKAYLESLPPAELKNRPNTMYFPTNLRAGLLGWRILFFNPHKVKEQPGWSDSVKRGAYLVQALEHCSACHTPRNIAMASIESRFLAGGHIISQGWYAPNITGSKSNGLGSWSDATLLDYLHEDGSSMKRGAPFGPMKSVVDDSLSRMPKASVQDIVAYLRTVHPLPSNEPRKPNADVISASDQQSATLAEGKQVYLEQCARCHQADGAGVKGNFPNLAHNEALWDGKPDNVQAMVLGGFQPWHKDQSSMPSFRGILTDGQIAAVTNYVRTAWGNEGLADDTASHVAVLGTLTTTEIELSAGTMQATITSGTDPVRFNDITGRIDFSPNRVDCRMNAQLGGAKGVKPMSLSGTCASQGNEFTGRVVSDGKIYPVVLRAQPLTHGNNVSGLRVWGTIPGLNEQIDAHVDFVSVNY